MKKLFILLTFVIFGLILTNCKQTLQTENIPEINLQKVTDQVRSFSPDPIMDQAFKAFIIEERDWLRKYVDPIAYKISKEPLTSTDKKPMVKKLLKKLLKANQKEFQKNIMRIYNLYVPEEKKDATTYKQIEEKIIASYIYRYICYAEDLF